MTWIVCCLNMKPPIFFRNRCGRKAISVSRFATPHESKLACGTSLNQGGFHAFTDNFQTLHGLTQLPGVAAQRLMADGYGFGAEGDWKTAALVRALKVMSAGLEGGTSFMEDYTYHFRAEWAGAGLTHAGNLSFNRCFAAISRNSSAVYRRKEGTRSAGLHRADRPCGGCFELWTWAIAFVWWQTK